jgi:hypothetical protein
MQETEFDEFVGLNLTEDEKRDIRKMRDRVRKFKEQDRTKYSRLRSDLTKIVGMKRAFIIF